MRLQRRDTTVKVRGQLNRCIAVVALIVLLPVVAVAERMRRGAGRSVARRSILRVGRLCGVVFEVRASSEFDRAGSYVVVPNHSSPVDIAAMLVACPDVRFVAAAGLFRIPLLAAAMRALDTIAIERHDSSAARKRLTSVSEESWDSESKVVIFAEGAIAPRGQRLPFKTGAFVLAIQKGVPVLPVAIHGTGDVLPPHHHLAVRPGTVTVEVLSPIPTEGLTVEHRGLLRDQVQGVVVSTLECVGLETTRPTHVRPPQHLASETVAGLTPATGCASRPR